MTMYMRVRRLRRLPRRILDRAVSRCDCGVSRSRIRGLHHSRECALYTPLPWLGRLVCRRQGHFPLRIVDKAHWEYDSYVIDQKHWKCLRCLADPIVPSWERSA